MEDGPRRDALGLEDGERVVPGLSGVDHQGQAVGVAQPDLGGEHLALHVPGRVVVVVVEPALADGHDFRLVQQRRQPVDAVLGFVGMHARRRPHPVEGAGDGDGGAGVLEPRCRP